MQHLKRFWRSLEVLPGGAAVAEEWRRLVGEELSHVRRLLRPTGELALTYPHRDPDLLYYRVVTHGPDDHVGVCDETLERLPLTTADLVVLGVDTAVLYRMVVAAFSLTLDVQPIDSLPSTVRLGHHEPLAGFRSSAILTRPASEAELEQAIDRLAVTEDRPFLLLAPTRQFLRPTGEDLLRQRRACFLALEESIVVGDDGQWALLAAARRQIEEFSARMLPAEKPQSDVAFFPTPAGSAWPEVKIHLVDGHTASIGVRGTRGVFTYAQMGMANRKSGNPSVQWELLRTFAANDGILTWRTSGADRRNQKRRELLARCLQRFFRIEGDPILPCGNGWKTRFRIEGLT